MKVYTKTGDKGKTSLVGGERVAKCDVRVEAYGTVDELMAFVALLGDNLRTDSRLNDIAEDTNRINSQLMTVASLLAVGAGGEGKIQPLKPEAVGYLENRIDALQAEVPPITKFTIPGGDVKVSLCHVCRTVCRRAERAALRSAAQYDLEPSATVYLNRLSDYFYLAGRAVTERLGVEEHLWIP